MLDGHHRALAAANTGELVPVLVTAEWRPDSDEWPSDTPLDARRLCAGFSPQRLWYDVSQDDIDRLKQAAQERSSQPLPREVVPSNLSVVYPTDREAEAYAVIIATCGDITNEVIASFLQGEIREFALYCRFDPLDVLIAALRGRRDPRLFPVAHQILKENRHVRYWRHLVQKLTMWPCAEVDDIFVEYLCRADEPDRPDLVATIDEYFRARNR